MCAGERAPILFVQKYKKTGGGAYLKLGGGAYEYKKLKIDKWRK